MSSMANLILMILFIILAIILAQYVDNNELFRGVVGGNRSTNTHNRSNKSSPKDIYKDLDLYPASRFETSVRMKIERIVGKKFPTVYPAWLIYKGKRLELDGYCEDLSLAFETQGPQHTKFSSKTDPLYIKYQNRIENDEAKIRLADENNIGLIVIDYQVPKYLLGAYIKSRIYDIAEVWRSRGLLDKLNKLGHLVYKPGDYVDPIIKKPIN